MKTFRPKLFDTFRDYSKKQFISDASHELKTPITIISASADVLKSENDNKWVNNIKEQTERMSALVTDMLALAKLEEIVVLLSTTPAIPPKIVVSAPSVAVELQLRILPPFLRIAVTPPKIFSSVPFSSTVE